MRFAVKVGQVVAAVETVMILVKKILKGSLFLFVVLQIRVTVIAGNPVLKGFVLSAIDGTRIEFVDVETGTDWDKDIEGYTFDGWVPDGCNVLISRPSDDYLSRQYYLL